MSRMFPISLYPNWAEKQQHSTCLCMAHFLFPNIYLSFLSGFHHPQGYASVSRKRAGRSNVRKADTKLLLSRADAHTDWGWGLEEGPAGALLSLQCQQTQMAAARAEDQIRWTAPNGWAMSLPMVTDDSNWEKGAWEKQQRAKCGQFIFYGNKRGKKMRIKWNFFWGIAVSAVSVISH